MSGAFRGRIGKATFIIVPCVVSMVFSPNNQVKSDEKPCVGSRVSEKNPPPRLDEKTFDELFELCRPCPEKETWTEVAWIGEFWAGRQEAARTGKPMFIFAMNGHPLGCV